MVSTSPRRPVNSDGSQNAPQPQPMPATAEESLKLSMTAIEKGGVILVAAEGNITLADVDPVQKNPFETLLGVNWATNRVLLNMQNAAYIDSAAIGWLMNSQKCFRDAGGKLVLYHLHPTVRQLLDVLKLGRVLAVVNDESDARQAIAQQNGGVR